METTFYVLGAKTSVYFEEHFINLIQLFKDRFLENVLVLFHPMNNFNALTERPLADFTMYSFNVS